MSTSFNVDQVIDINNSATNDNNASPLSNIIYFIILTIIYCIATIVYLYTNKDIESIYTNSNNKILILIYILFLLAGNYYLNLKTAKMICPNSELSELYSKILIITIMPWVLIFVIIYLLLELFNGWIRPFSNTIGYFIINFFNIKKVIQKLLNTNTKEFKTIGLQKVFKYIDNHPEKFINEFTTELVDYSEFIKELKKDNIFISDDLENSKDIIELYKLLTIKNVIGKIIWFILAGLLICSITYNYIINIKCIGSVTYNKTKIDELYN